MKIGITGTQKGMTATQYNLVIKFFNVNLLNVVELHSGDCVGADADFIYAAEQAKLVAHTVGHIPNNPSKRAFLEYDELREPLPYLERNHNIVDECDLLIATPWEKEEQLRSGTWATIRYAKKQNKPIMIIYPDGEITHLNNNKLIWELINVVNAIQTK